MARPSVWLNCAVSLDGRLAGPGGAPVRLSDGPDMERVHRIRRGADAIMVGVSTILADDPGLLAKRAGRTAGPHPLRVVLDTNGRTPAQARVRSDGHPSLLVTQTGAGLTPDGAVDVLEVPTSGQHLDLVAVLEALADRGHRRIMVEGGARVLKSFIDEGLWDRFTVYQAPWVLGDGPVLWPGGWRPPLGKAVPTPAGEGVLWTFSRGS